MTKLSRQAFEVERDAFAREIFLAFLAWVQFQPHREQLECDLEAVEEALGDEFWYGRPVEERLVARDAAARLATAAEEWNGEYAEVLVGTFDGLVEAWTLQG